MSRLDHPLGENHLGSVVREWPAHYNRGRPHMSLGPGIPDPPEDLPVPVGEDRHTLAGPVSAQPVLSGLHHEYRRAA